jgi:peptide/nickel transport system permease protein
MGHIFKTAFQSGKFRFGFIVLTVILLLIVLFPLFVRTDPLQMEGGMFEPPNIRAMLGKNSESKTADQGAAISDSFR